MLLRAGGACFIEPRQASLPLGLSELAAVSREPVSARFGPSDQILFYTDGISEARDRAGEFYPLERISAVIRGHDLDAALSLLAEDLIRYVGHPLADDAAMLLIRHAARPGGANGTPVSTASSRVQSGSETGAGGHGILGSWA